jgi:hypothetical protein
VHHQPRRSLPPGRRHNESPPPRRLSHRHTDGQHHRRQYPAEFAIPIRQLLGVAAFEANSVQSECLLLCSGEGPAGRGLAKQFRLTQLIRCSLSQSTARNIVQRTQCRVPVDGMQITAKARVLNRLHTHQRRSRIDGYGQSQFESQPTLFRCVSVSHVMKNIVRRAPTRRWRVTAIVIGSISAGRSDFLCVAADAWQILLAKVARRYERCPPIAHQDASPRCP